MNRSIEAVETFLRAVDRTFPVPLSDKRELHGFAVKLCEKATLCTETDGEKIVAMVAGYTENIVDNMAYISVVATLPEAQGRGLASKLILEFIRLCEAKNIDAVHLYAVPENVAAVRMYEKLGFVRYEKAGESRPDDVHFIYYIRKERT